LTEQDEEIFVTKYGEHADPALQAKLIKLIAAWPDKDQDLLNTNLIQSVLKCRIQFLSDAADGGVPVQTWKMDAKSLG